MTPREKVLLHAKTYREAALSESVHGHTMTGKALAPAVVNRVASDLQVQHPEYVPYMGEWKRVVLGGEV